jgi:hypothetical protein
VGTYDQLPGLEHLYLEDSYLLGVHEGHDELRFDVEAVLTEDHPRYVPRKPDEAYTYLRVAIVFSDPRSVTWIERPMKPITGPDGEIDYGNIDSFTWQNDRYELIGDWGHVVIDGPPPAVLEHP